MRAVPENFDNVQALHSPYGAVHGLGPPVPSPSDMGNHQFGEQLNRSLIVDVRRPETEDNLSSAGLTPSFDTTGFAPVGGTSSSGMISPPSSTSHDRFDLYGSHFTSGLGISTRSTAGFSANPSRMETPVQASRHGIRQLQPLHIRDPPIRPRTEAVQSPLRSGLTWKGDTIDYSSYQAGNNSTYHQMGPASGVHTGSYDPDSYSGTVTPSACFVKHTEANPASAGTPEHSSQNLGYSSFHPSSPERPRLRASSATFPLNLDLRNQHGIANQRSQPSAYSLGNRTPTTSANFASPSIYTTSYPPAPLTAPITMAQQSASSPQKPEASGHSEQAMAHSSAGRGAYTDGNQANTTAVVSPQILRRESLNNAELSFEPQQRMGSYGQHLSTPNASQRRSSFPMPGVVDEQRSISSPQAFDNTH